MSELMQQDLGKMTAQKQQLLDIAQQSLSMAEHKGASAAEVGLNSSQGYSVTARLGEVETVEFNRDKGIGITVYFGQCKGSASTSDTSAQALEETVAAACNIAQQTGEDACHGLADAKLMAQDHLDLDLYHPWGLEVEAAIAQVIACEKEGLEVDKRIENSEGASISTHNSLYVYANSHGFIGSYPTSRHSISCALIAKQKDVMQQDYAYTVARDPHELKTLSWVGREAAQKVISRLGARQLSTRQCPVIFKAEIAGGLLASFISAIKGSSLYRKSSFLLDHIGKQVFASQIQIKEQPHLLKALGSAPFDNEGVSTKERDLVVDGILQSYVLSSYSARKLGLTTTGNAGGVRNVVINTDAMDFDGLLKKMGTGLLVTELMGHGVNIVNGDYSRGAAGFWVENGEIQYPVEEITIAGNLRDIFRNLVAIANDVDKQHNIRSGSILVEQMTVAGA